MKWARRWSSWLRFETRSAARELLEDAPRSLPHPARFPVAVAVYSPRQAGVFASQWAGIVLAIKQIHRKPLGRCEWDAPGEGVGVDTPSTGRTPRTRPETVACHGFSDDPDGNF